MSSNSIPTTDEINAAHAAATAAAEDVFSQTGSHEAARQWYRKALDTALNAIDAGGSPAAAVRYMVEQSKAAASAEAAKAMPRCGACDQRIEQVADESNPGEFLWATVERGRCFCPAADDALHSPRA